MTQRIPLSKIVPDPNQPRKTFDSAELDELAASIKAKGLIQPITVRKGKANYIIVAGERRYRAHCLLHDRGDKRFASIDANVRQVGDVRDIRIKQLVENIQRADMPILEEADAFAELVKLGMTEDEIAADLGLAVFRVRWRLQLQNLAPNIRKLVAGGYLDRQQAMEIARLDRHHDQTRIERMINRGDLVGWKAVRNAVDAILNPATAADLFGESAPVASLDDVRTLNAMERKIEAIDSMVAAGWRNGECIIATRVSPNRASAIADRLATIRTAISHMERELRNVTAQGKIALAR